MIEEIKYRNKEIIKTSIIGIIANFFLALFKALIGFFSNSIAIILDAVNNISDVSSSLITIIGTKLASKAPDKEHPFGHGRIEYITAQIIAILVLYAGITSLIESIKKIINPVKPDYKIISLIIILVAVIVKIFLGLYFNKKGKKLKSSSLINSGNDALLDSIISIGTLVAALIFIFTGFSLEAYLGALISLVIIKSGIDMLRSASSSVLGERADLDISKKINKIIYSFDEVKGVFDLIINNYGPNSLIASVHIEVMDTMMASEIDLLIREITNKVFEETGVIMSAIGIYSFNTKDKEAAEIKNTIQKQIKKYKGVLQFHGFYYDKKSKTIRFDLVFDFNIKNRKELFDKIYNDIKSLYKDYEIIITEDLDYSLSK